MNRVRRIGEVLVAGWLCWQFLPRWWFAVPAAWWLGKQWNQWQQARAQRERHRRIHVQFRFFLEIFATALRGGANARRALQAVYPELIATYRTDAEVVQALQKTLAYLRIHQNLESSLTVFAKTLDDRYVHRFCQGVQWGIRRGTDLRKLAASYHRLLGEQLRLEEERRAGLAAAEREQRMLFCMPLVLLFALRGLGMTPDRLGSLDVLTRLFCLGLFAIAWQWTKRIVAHPAATL